MPPPKKSRMKRGAKLNKRSSWLSNSVVVMIMFACTLCLFTWSSFDGYVSVQAENKNNTLFEGFMKNVFPVFSRGGVVDRSSQQNNQDKKSIYQKIFTNIYPTMMGDYVEIASEKKPLNFLNEYEGETIEESDAEKSPDKKIVKEYDIVSSQKLPQKVTLNLDQPVVYLYHTHATESYMPKDEGNFHSVEESSTVREVGERVAKNLREKGIKVIHDKTVHDYPSYRESYVRSLKTIKTGLEKNKSVKIVIDMHRDASDYKKNRSELPIIDGQQAACFSFVLGTKNKNAKELKIFAEYILHKSDIMYPGLGEGIIEKPYKFNQYVSDYYLLLEVGDNQNNIKEALKTADCFSEILYEVIEDIKK